MAGSRVFISSMSAPPAGTRRSLPSAMLTAILSAEVWPTTSCHWSPRSPPSTSQPGGADLRRLLGTSHALASDRLDESVEIVAAIVVRDFAAGLDVLDGADLDH